MQSSLRSSHSTTRVVAVLAAAVALLVAVSQRAEAQCNGHWIGGHPVPGVAGPVYCSAVFDDGSGPALFVGGYFSVAGDQSVSNIAKWDGERWSSVGTHRLNGLVFAMTVFDDHLYVGGDFTAAGRDPVNGVARLEGGRWREVAPDLLIGGDPCVFALHVHKGELFVGGNFSRSLVRLQGGQWAPIPGLNVTGPVWAITNFAGELVFGGAFSSAASGVNGDRNIARWDGSVCRAVGGGTDGPVRALASFGDSLIAGGDFSSVYQQPSSDETLAARVAAWDGSAWSAFQPGFDDSVFALAVLDGELYCAGRIWFGAGDRGAIARLADGKWMPVGNGFSLPTRTVALFNGDLFAGHEAVTLGISRLELNTWSEFGSGLAAIRRIQPYGGGVLADNVRIPESPEIRGLATFDGTEWRAFGNPDDEANYTLLGVISGSVFAVRNASEASGRVVVLWNGSEWAQLGGEFDGSVEAITSWNGELVICGAFTHIGSDAISRVAVFSQGHWASIGVGISDGTAGSVAEFNGDLYVAGNFSQSGASSVRCIARFDGHVWQPVGQGFQQSIGGQVAVFGLAVFDGELIAAGRFGPSADQPGRCISRWDGAAWRELPGATSQYAAVSRLVVLRDHLIATYTLFVGGGSYSFLAWDGTVVRHILGGVQSAYVCAWDDRTMALAGQFSQIGTGVGTQPVISHSFARYRFDSADYDGDGYVTGQDFDEFVAAFEAGAPAADIDEDGFLSGLDYDRFAIALLNGC